MSEPEVLSAGIVVADHVSTPIPHLPAAGGLVKAEGMLLTIGGCAANAAVDLVKMGVRAAVVGRVGDDRFGDIVVDILREQGVDTQSIQRTKGIDTSQTLIINVEGEDRRFVHTFGANGEFCASDIPTKLGKCRILYVGGFLVMPKLMQEELAEVFAKARSQKVKTVLDVVVPGPGDYLAQLESLLPHVDVFLPNNHEAELISKKSDPIDQAKFFRDLGVTTAVITMGNEGAILMHEDETLRSGVYSVPYVDGSGGGDAFDAGFIYGMLHNLDPATCLRVASAMGASCVRAIGTTPGVFTRDECEQFISEHSLRVEVIS